MYTIQCIRYILETLLDDNLNTIRFYVQYSVVNQITFFFFFVECKTNSTGLYTIILDAKTRQNKIWHSRPKTIMISRIRNARILRRSPIADDLLHIRARVHRFFVVRNVVYCCVVPMTYFRP